MVPQSTFSYAQAAKGQGATPASNSSAAPDAAASSQDAQASIADADGPAPAIDAKPSAPTTEQANSEAPESMEQHATSSEKQSFESVHGSESDARSESTQSRRTESRREDDTGRLDRPWRRNEKMPRSSSNTTRSVDEQDSRKARRNKKSKTSEKQSSDQATEKEQEAAPEPPKVELSEAPIPIVNIWHKRKEAQQAKSTRPVLTPAEATVNGTSSQKHDKKTEENTSTACANGIKAQQKPSSAVRLERNGPRGSRTHEKDGKTEIPPSVEDSTAWPTPDTAITAIKEDNKKKVADKTPEKLDRSDKDSQEDGSASKPRQKWVAIDYVPTVSFETQLPQMRSSKPRGGARGGRDTAPRGTANGVADKTASTAPASKTNDIKPKENSNNAPSQLATVKRGTAEGVNGHKRASANTGSEKAKDTPAQSSEASQSRDRHDGRGERARGNYRGRGAHHGHSQSQHAISASGFHGQGASAARSQGYSPPLRQGSHGSMFTPPSQRGRGRNGAHNFHRVSVPNGGSRMPVVQAQYSPYDYSMAAPIGAVPFHPLPFDHLLVLTIKIQIEYYFSIENLCKDEYLRKRMDSQGFVPLHFISAFSRIQRLTQDMNVIRAACEESTEVDFVVGDDECERLRRRHNWEHFVYSMENRDELARNAGPVSVTFKNRHYHFPGGPFDDITAVTYGAHAYPHGPALHHFTPHGGNGDIPNGNTQLSAAVPDFSPSGTIPLVGPHGDVQVTSVEALTNGHVEQSAPLTNGVHVGEAHATQL
ncbi:la family [Fusarium beomiforme]|uniref:La family n=1 Tax=Fusarium beomiforme TaxID=44412 RepID=A0A9P5AHJ1_9HYPO|nr:la family [Fusarium beomiforme]